MEASPLRPTRGSFFGGTPLSRNRWDKFRTPEKWDPTSVTKGEKAFHFGSDFSHNPNRGLLTLDAEGKILLANGVVADFLNTPIHELIGRDFYKDLILKEKGLESLQEEEILTDGSKCTFPGQVVELLKKDGSKLSVSLWTKDIEDGSKRIVLIDLVECRVAEVVVSKEDGGILYSNLTASALFSTTSEGSIKDQYFGKYLPHLSLEIIRNLKDDGSTYRTKTTGQTEDHVNFPVALNVKSVDENSAVLIIWVFSSLSGLIVMSENGVVQSCNSNFTNLLFGYKENELVGKEINDLIPSIYNDCDIEGTEMISRRINIEDLGCKRLDGEEDEGDEDDYLGVLTSGLQISDSASEEKAKVDLSRLTSTPTVSKRTGEKVSKYHVSYRCKNVINFPEGSFFGFGRHKNGSELAILYQIRRVALDDGSQLYCLWLSREPEEDPDVGKMYGTLTLASTLDNIPDESLGQAIRNVVEKRKAEGNSICLTHYEDSELIKGDYSEKYQTLHQIGKGGFGCVKAAYRRDDELMVITKFIKKSKIYEEYWIEDKVLGTNVSLEISLLTTLSHPNIISVIDVFENDDYFQMVMSKHGPGIDLFEFIDRRPKMNEDLCSYIFRQVVSAVMYLHERDIIHRDIKDENIIIDTNFSVKLVDFGSATFVKPGWLFSTFYGTVEYCSPDVLSGNHYAGPELEAWSLGVLLYIIIFGENPFFNIDETIECKLFPPFAASPPCIQLIKSILTKDPLLRYRVDQIMNHPWTLQEVNPTTYKFEEVVSCSKEELNSPIYYPNLIQSENYVTVEEEEDDNNFGDQKSRS